MRAAWIVASLVAAAAASLGVVEHTRMRAEITRVRSEVDALTRRLSAAEAASAQGSLLAPSIAWPLAANAAADGRIAAAPAPLAPARSAASPRATPPADPIEDFAPVHDALEAAFAAESVDGPWATRARRTAAAHLDAKLPEGSRIDAIECRSTLCRVRSVHPSAARADEFASGVALRNEAAPWAGDVTLGVIEQAPNGTAVTVVAYLAREGVNLPFPSSDEGS